jgi:hypothetical protein
MHVAEQRFLRGAGGVVCGEALALSQPKQLQSHASDPEAEN